MDEFSNIWIEQCEAARDIRDAWEPGRHWVPFTRDMAATATETKVIMRARCS
jgi:hypothetical protein